ncbi:hypothetical protein MAR_004578 [Mya arenaria]|uniref:Uncharacterized protein n=1 Tax=Mya arenaria TaxID=6604 RepID=A0ABY7EWZ3_MYAAR|nr:hypothetical protein MAR_004578 [Mya arenaria]
MSLSEIESAQKFGENNLCKTQDQRQMLQKALIGKVCSSSDKQRNKGFNNEDGRVSHFEENMFYNNN